MWANRLKAILSISIGLNQSAFVPSRMLHDNAMIAHELLHYLQSDKNGPNKGFVTKLNMSKTYDCVEWDFLKAILHQMGFSSQWIMWIMECAQSVKYTVKCYSCLMDVICPKCGP